ncbi:MAG: hypothetical protein A2Y12_02485 [Planctomycetes bacterium GWF2_42_9]|nr:MAG: hypothetical protein A2Y12_02485 [Planctomycetes bacterium GWF2_42_9]
MKELTKVLGSAITGPLKQKAIETFEKQMQEWGIIMPPVEPLVMDFGLGDFYHTGLIEYWIANEIEAGYCGKFLFVFDKQTCPAHQHTEKHETFYIVKGCVQMFYNGKTFEMNAGDLLTVEVNNVHSFTGIGSALLLEISKPCLIQDNHFMNSKINIAGEQRTFTIVE